MTPSFDFGVPSRSDTGFFLRLRLLFFRFRLFGVSASGSIESILSPSNLFDFAIIGSDFCALSARFAFLRVDIDVVVHAFSELPLSLSIAGSATGSDFATVVGSAIGSGFATIVGSSIGSGFAKAGVVGTNSVGNWILTLLLIVGVCTESRVITTHPRQRRLL